MKYKKLNKGTFEIDLKINEQIKIFEPDSIILFDGEPQKRKKEFLNISSELSTVLTQRKMTLTSIDGPASFVISLPKGCYIYIFEISGNDSLLYNFKNILFVTNGIEYKKHYLIKDKLSIALATKTISACSFSGKGYIGIFSDAELIDKDISNKSIYINTDNIVSLSQSADVNVVYYGNDLSAQTMEMHYLIKGTQESGEKIIYQAAKISNMNVQNQSNSDSLIMRLIKKYIPGADILLR